MVKMIERTRGVRVEINNSHLGFFAHLNWLVLALGFSAKSGIPVQFSCTSRQYVSPERGTNFLDYFFVDLKLRELSIPVDETWIRISQIQELIAPEDYPKRTFEMANSWFFGRFALQRWVVEANDHFFAGRSPDRKLIGVHYRGTDKSSEAPQTPYQRMLAAIDHELTSWPDADVFLATDEEGFLAVCHKRYGRRLSFLQDHARSSDGKAIHKDRELDGFQIGRDALLNSLALSRCDKVIKTPSTMSGWAKIMTPCLPVFLMDRPYDACSWFPDRDLPSYQPPDKDLRNVW